MFENIATAFAHSLRVHGNKPAITLSECSLTFEELGREVARWANYLEEHSVDVETPIACQMKHGLNPVIALLAIWKSGRTVIPVLCDTTPVELQQILEHSTARLILADSFHSSLLNEVTSTDQVVVNVEEANPKESPLEDDIGEAIQSSHCPAIVIYTSGSTGRPKGVIHSHRSLLFNNQVHTESLNITSKDSALLLATWNTISGVTDILRMLLNGGTIIPVDLHEFGVSGISTAIRRHHPTIVHFVPTVFRRMIKQTSVGEVFDSIRVLHLGGEPVTRYDFDMFCMFFPPDCVLLNNFGCAEVPTFRQSILNQNTTWAGTVVPLNREVAGKEVRVVKPGTLDQVPVGQKGEITIQSEHCALGYWREPELTQQSFHDLGEGISVYKTGDFGRFLTNGMLESLGREDRQVKRLGRKIDLLEIETALNQFTDLNEACVTFHEQEYLSRLCAFISSSTGGKPKTFADDCQKLGELALGLEFIFIRKLPTLPGGKIDRKQLQELAQNHPRTQQSESFSAPKTKTELRVAEIWKSILNVEAVGTKTDFFQQGGDSLAMIDCLTMVEKELGKSVPKTSLVKYPKLGDFASAIDEQPDSKKSNCLEQVFENSHDVQVLFVGMNLARLAMPYFANEYSIFVFHVDGYQTNSFRGLTIAEIVDQAIGELRSAEIPVPTTIVGFSYGGLVAYSLAERIGQLMSIFPTVMLIEPSAPLPSSRLALVKEKFREYGRRFLPGKQHRFKTQSLQIKDLSGEQMTSEERWELVRPTIRRNRRLYSPNSYSGDILLVGRPEYLKSGRLWHQLAEKNIQVILLDTAKNHDTTLEPDAVKIWAAELQANLSQGKPSE